MKIMLASAHCVHETAAHIRILFLILPFCCYFIAKSYYISYHIDICSVEGLLGCNWKDAPTIALPFEGTAKQSSHSKLGGKMITIISHTEANGSHSKPIQKLPDMYAHCNEIQFLLVFPCLEKFFICANLSNDN